MLTQQATGTGAIASALAFSSPVLLDEVRCHLSAAGGAGTLTITINRGAGAAYDLVIKSQDMTSVTDLHFIPDAPIYLFADDTLDIAWANASGRTYGLEIIYRPTV